MRLVSLFTREWIEIPYKKISTPYKNMSPSLRGSGLKYHLRAEEAVNDIVSLFTREWIEIVRQTRTC